ncbi:alpha/beta fold hydrolase [Streptomyces sp. LP05-1]|uniref:Alpha/beta fold hydrolase n=1 Tax=Streptomyces pyxinae TaxID=2970734 RepID=A0ABT2CLS7_9ACTN|nr:alpha/beta fold hydrolase [Streptomyces sp. LP05-1]MCS0638384.1 alpha/beta fold hydrolase [Streptomyces sp. LP05-1]
MAGAWFRRYDSFGGGPEAPGSVRLVCFPHAGGAASSYIRLSRTLAPAVEVLAVQYPGRQDRRQEEPVADIGRLADALAQEVETHVDGVYAFFGHSMGALLAYETAARLADRGAPGPAALILSGRQAPRPVPSPHDRLLTDADILAAVRRLGGTTPAVLDDPELRDMVMPALRADYRAIGSYAWRERPPLDTPLTVLIGDADPVVHPQEALAWREFTTGPTGMHTFTGGHFYLDEHLGGVADAITRTLARHTPAGAGVRTR